MSNGHSLRYSASVQLHQLDYLTSCFNRVRIDLLSVLQRCITTLGQYESVARLRASLARRKGSTTSITEQDPVLMQAKDRFHAVKLQLESTLAEMTTLSGQVNQLSAQISQDIGQINSNPALDDYGRSLDHASFNYEYKELQRAAQIIQDQAKLLNNEIRLKMVQYQHCPTTQYSALLSAWQRQPVDKTDQDMEDLADLMMS